MSLSHASPRPAWPPWPEPALACYRFDLWQAPMRPQAIGFENAQVQESWSEYALVRDGLSFTPVVVPAFDASGCAALAPGQGAVRFWFCPDWTSAGQGGKGPGCHARLLELTDLGGYKPTVRWSLYASPAGDELFFSGRGGIGRARDFLSTPVGFVAGQWQLVTLAYGPEGSELWLGDQLVAVGEGVPEPTASRVPWQALVVGSDLAVTAAAGGQFEELTTFDYWPDPDQLQFYYHGVSRQVWRGTVETAEVEAAKEELLAVMSPQPMAWTAEGGGVPMAASHGSGDVWLDLTGVTNLQADFVIHTPWPAAYDLFITTNLSANVPGLNGTNWAWEARVNAGVTNFFRPAGTHPNAFYRLGTMLDSDGDGLTDAYENLVSHTPPGTWNSLDTDGDGLPDGWEMARGTDPKVSDALADPDGDGLSNRQEYLAGTDPLGAPAFTPWMGMPRTGTPLP